MITRALRATERDWVRVSPKAWMPAESTIWAKRRTYTEHDPFLLRLVVRNTARLWWDERKKKPARPRTKQYPKRMVLAMTRPFDWQVPQPSSSKGGIRPVQPEGRTGRKETPPTLAGWGTRPKKRVISLNRKGEARAKGKSEKHEGRMLNPNSPKTSQGQASNEGTEQRPPDEDNNCKRQLQATDTHLQTRREVGQTGTGNPRDSAPQ